MTKSTKLLTPDEMRDHIITVPMLVEQMRAKLLWGIGQGNGLVASWCRQVDPSRRFHSRVREFAKNKNGDVPYMDLWEMLNLQAVIMDAERPRMNRKTSGNRNNGRKPNSGFPKGRGVLLHRALADD